MLLGARRPAGEAPRRARADDAGLRPPVFVEDMAREVSAACRSRDLAHRVTVRNLESIHSHDALAVVNG
ncbi:GTP cyclohydrolase, FolE2/MptA family [Streptomyces sp. WMMC940]|uniref:GTP cyclohydrolase, FolE2/MptA family n=1 Tax=Streptomyces sp. WMMC940 TaxID=3015153 RepID=UPI003FCEB16D